MFPATGQPGALGKKQDLTHITLSTFLPGRLVEEERSGMQSPILT